MKRFFFVFTIIMVIFLVLAAGSIAVVDNAGINALSSQSKTGPVFIGHLGVTLLPFTSASVTYPDGDLFLIKQISAADVKPGNIVLYANGSKWYVRSGLVVSKTDKGFNITSSDGLSADEPAASIIGLYSSRVPYMGRILKELESPLAVIIFAVVLLLSIVLWRVLPSGKSANGVLSNSDSDIASILY